MKNINTLRGMACLMLMSFHVIGATPGHAMQVSDGVLRYFADFMGYIRMPLFAFIAGYFYTVKPLRRQIINKFNRLIVPMLTVGTLFAVVKHAAIEPFDFSTIHIIPVAHYWFLEAIFLCFLITSIFDKLSKKHGLFIVSILSVVAIFFIDTSGGASILSLNKMIYLMPFFILGTAYRHGLWKIMVVLFMSFSLMIEVKQELFFMFFVGAMACTLSIEFLPKINFLDYIGGHSYAIYLFHVFFTAPVVIVLNGSINDVIVIVLAITAGIVPPIIANKVLTHKFFRHYIFGEFKLPPQKYL